MFQDAADNKSEPSNEARRTRRFALRLPVRYRLENEKTWRSGETENVSRSGVLLRSYSAPRAGTCLEMCLDLPALTSEEAPEMICQGIVVRSARATDGGVQALAVRILHSRLTRG